MAKRLRGRFGYPMDEPFRVTLHPDKLREPEAWKRGRRIFVCSMGDLFHEEVPFEFIDQVFITMMRCPQQTFMLLTKRPERMRKYYQSRLRDDGLLKIDLGGGWKMLGDMEKGNVWVGVSAETQKMAIKRVPVLINIPSPVHFVSVEPMLQLISLIRAMDEPEDEDWERVNQVECENDISEPEEFIEECEAECDWINYGNDLVVNPEWKEWYSWRALRAKWAKMGRCLQWVICGAESGPGARPMGEIWARELKDQCVGEDIPFFYKQGPVDGKLVKMPVLDGRVWDQVPGVAGGIKAAAE
jgi:protein gp37